MNKIFPDIPTITLWEKIKLLFRKAQYNYDFENGIIIKYKEMNKQLYILQMIFIEEKYE